MHPVRDEPFHFTFSQNPTQLNKSPYDLYFIQKVKIVRDERQADAWKVTTLSYEYAIVRRGDRQELLAFHWEGHDAKKFYPHLHIGFAANASQSPLTPKKHIPSGRVLVEDLVKFLIEELGVKPTKNKTGKWTRIIEVARAAVMKYKTW